LVNFRPDLGIKNLNFLKFRILYQDVHLYQDMDTLKKTRKLIKSNVLKNMGGKLTSKFQNARRQGLYIIKILRKIQILRKTKTKFQEKIEITNFLLNIEILRKNRNFEKKSKFLEKVKILRKIENYKFWSTI